MEMNAQILQFLRELKENNDRAWFQANKERYDRLRAGFLDEVQQLIEGITLFDPTLLGLEAKNCTYRIYRDLRFSMDRTPYKTHFAAYMAFGGRPSDYGGYYIHLEPGNCMLAGGVWCPPPKLLKLIRRDIYDQGEELQEILENSAFKQVYGTFQGESLKRLPDGFPADSPYPQWIKLKDFSIHSPKPDSFFTQPDWMKQTLDELQLLFPLNRFFNFAVDEYMGKV